MKIPLLAGALALTLAASAAALDPAPPAAAPADRDFRELSTRLREAADQIDDLRKRLETVEKRLGESYRAPTPFDTVERRLDDLEKDVSSLKRR